MKLQERIEALAYLGNYLSQNADERLLAVMRRSQADNAWFTPESMECALNAIRDSFLDKTKLSAWANRYSIDNQFDTPYKTVGLICPNLSRAALAPKSDEQDDQIAPTDAVANIAITV